MKNTWSPQANSIYHQLSPKTHGMEKYLAMQHKRWAFLDFSTAEKLVFRIGLKTNITPQSLPILISFYRHKKSSGTHINGGVMCCLILLNCTCMFTFTALVLNVRSFLIDIIRLWSGTVFKMTGSLLKYKCRNTGRVLLAMFSVLTVFLPALYSVHICFTSLNIQIELGDVICVGTFFSLLHFRWIIQVVRTLW